MTVDNDPSNATITITGDIPTVVFDGQEPSGRTLELRENAGRMEIYDPSASEVVHVFNTFTNVDLLHRQPSIDVTVTGVQDQTNLYHYLDQDLLDSISEAYLETGRTDTGSGESVDVELYNVSTSSVVTTVTLSGASNRTRSSDFSGSLTANDQYRARFNVTSAASSGTATWYGARLIYV